MNIKSSLFNGLFSNIYGIFINLDNFLPISSIYLDLYRLPGSNCFQSDEETYLLFSFV